jgi:ABC-2 type transport system permease protein
MSGLSLLMRKELLEQVRTMRLVVVVSVFALFGLVSPLLARYIREIIQAVGGDQLQGMVPPPTVGDAVAQFSKNIGEFGMLFAVLLSMGAVATERDRGTAAFVVTKPVSRAAFVTAKLVMIGGLLALATAASAVLCWVYTAILFEPLPVPGFAAGAAVLWLSITVFAALTFLASVVAPSALVAGGLGLGAVLVAGVLAALPVIGPYSPVGLWSAANQLAVGTVPDGLAGPVVLGALIVAGSTAAAAWVFAHREL